MTAVTAPPALARAGGSAGGTEVGEVGLGEGGARFEFLPEV